jgi:hypothetical protein
MPTISSVLCFLECKGRISFYFLDGDRRLRKATKRAAPSTAQIMGKGWEPILIQGQRGRSNFWAINVPIKAPIKPRTIEVKQPSLRLPAMPAPIEPVMAAIKSKNRKENIFIFIL